MNSMQLKVESASFASGLLERLEGFRSTMTTAVDTFVAYSADRATTYSVTIEMTIKPFSAEATTSASHQRSE